MLSPSRFMSSYLPHIPQDPRLGTRPLVVRRHRSAPSSKKSKPAVANLRQFLNEHVSDHNRKGALDLLVPFNSREQQKQHPEQPQHRHHIPHEQPHQPFVPNEPPFRPPRARPVPHWVKGQSPRPRFPDIGDAEPITYFENNVQTWANDLATSNRMRAFGLDGEDSRKLLRAFVKDVKASRLSDSESFAYYGLERFAHDHHNKTVDIDTIYNTVFFSWAADSSRGAALENKGIAPNTLDLIRRLVKATSRSFPADEYPDARSIHRKVILHVGPTNSGKTHHALRALAAAKSGVYAGPLRLLAHEIWHRLNTGKIIPLGVDASPADFQSNGNPKYATPCNMVTGEERKFVPDAQLISCTVEMLPYHQTFDVAVVDEIQLISDPDRGGGWANAVHGLRARELHLCGEDTAVPIVQKLLQHTGDEIIVKRYERLTPLTVENKSLGGTLKKVKKGDCIVTFSRNSIFSVKKNVERETGLKCAVVYGRLPPEVRNEQAALFNDPDSDHDVIIGSDAIGMGLNLKIQRVIFEAMHKYYASSTGKIPLSISSVKQIAGRAGRYGLHAAKVDLGGTTTTLHDDDLPFLKHTMGLPNKPLYYGYVDVSVENLTNVLSILPPGTSMEVATQACRYVGRLPSYLRYTEMMGKESTYRFIDKEWGDMSVADKLLILHAPIPWRDWVTVDIIRRLLHVHANESSVRLADITRGHEFMKVTEDIEKLMNTHSDREKPTEERSSEQEKATTANSQLSSEKKEIKKEKKLVNSEGLMSLEALHKILVFYIWMGFRNNVVYSDINAILELKERVEKVLNWTLSHMTAEPRQSLPRVGKGKSHLKKSGQEMLPQVLETLPSSPSPASHHQNVL